MPEHRARRFGRFMLKWSVRLTLVSVIVGAIGTSVVVAYPTVLDRLADDYEWFGDDTAWVARTPARDAHEAVKEFVREL